MTNSVTMSRAVATEALDCVLVRVRWYITRRVQVPPETLDAMFTLCDLLGVDPPVGRS